MNNLSYGSLSPTVDYSAIADSVEQMSRADVAVSPSSVKPYLPVYDDDDDEIIFDLAADAQAAVERYADVHTTKRMCRAEFLRPLRRIKLPFGPHTVVKVEQRSSVDEEYEETQDYKTVGLNFLSIELMYRRMTRVTFESGCEAVPRQITTAIKQEIAFKYKNRNDPEQVAAESRAGLSVLTRNSLDVLDRSQFSANEFSG